MGAELWLVDFCSWKEATIRDGEALGLFSGRLKGSVGLWE